MLTRKHFRIIARIIRGLRPAESSNNYCNGKNHVLTDLVKELAVYFANDNPKFDRQRFLDACKIN